MIRRVKKISTARAVRSLVLCCLFLSGAGPLLAKNGFSIGLNGGFEADTYQYGLKYAKVGYTSGLVTGSQAFFNDLNGIATINRLLVDFDDAKNTPVPGSPGIAIFENYSQALRNESGPNKFIQPLETAPGLISTVVGVNAKYVEDWITFRFGLTYDFFLPTRNSFRWNDNYQQFPEIFSANQTGLTSQQVIDLVLLKSRATGIAILPSTGGRDVTISSEVRALRVEIPFTVAFNFINTPATTAYLGGGLTWFYGSTTRILSDSLPNTVEDVDRFTGSTVGFHILTGAEYQFIRDTTLSVEVIMNYGEAGPLEDQVISENPYTVNSFFHTLKNEDSPGPEDGARASRLVFTGYRILVGVNYYLTI